MSDFPPLLPSPWIRQYGQLLPPASPVLDLACGEGRHGRWFWQQGHSVTLVDRQTGAVQPMAGPRMQVITADLEDGSPWPLEGHTFAAVVVTNYLHRPLWPHILASVATGGFLLYETFARGNEAFGRPRNPHHLLEPGELLSVAAGGGLTVVAYQHGLEQRTSGLRVIQRLCARRGDAPCLLSPGQ